MIDYKRLAEAETHPLRLQLLEAFAELSAPDETRSNAELCQIIGSTSSHVDYHLGALEAHHLIEKTGETKQGGQTLRFFRLAPAEVAA